MRMNATPAEAVWIVDAQTLCIVEVNDAALGLSGHHRDAMLGQAVTALAATPEDAALWAELPAGDSLPRFADSLLQCADGRVRPVTRRISAIELDGRRVWMVAMRERAAAWPSG